MELIEPFKRGYLLSPPQGKLLKRTWQKKYYAVYQADHLGIERIEIFDTEEQFVRHHSPNKLIPLNDCIKVVQSPQKQQCNVFEVICKNQIYQFSAETTQELAEWVTALQTVAFGQQRRESHPTLTMPILREPIGAEDLEQEENLIYSSMSSPELFVVQVIETEASKRCGLRGSYQLSVTSLNISIAQLNSIPKSNKPLHTWPYRHIRRFSRTKETFSFEAGRKCTTGEGLFSFETKEGNAIFQSVGMYLKSFKKLEPSLSSQKAVSFAVPRENNITKESKMPRNFRNSPVKELAVNPVASSKLSISESSLVKGTPNPSDGLYENYENTLLGKLRPPIIKPPRKSKLNSTSVLSTSLESVPTSADNAVDNVSSEPSPSPKDEVHAHMFSPKLSPSSKQKPDLVYDTPEERKDAWKTFALEKDNIHMENIPEDVAALYASVDITTLSSRSSYLKRHVSVPEVAAANVDPPVRQISMFSQRSRNSDGSYDHLFQFHTQKNSPSNPDHIYKKLQPPDDDMSDPLYSSVEYEMEKEPPMTEPQLPDSKSSPKLIEANDTSGIKHIIQNDEVYSVVVKPNRKPPPID